MLAAFFQGLVLGSNPPTGCNGTSSWQHSDLRPANITYILRPSKMVNELGVFMIDNARTLKSIILQACEDSAVNDAEWDWLNSEQFYKRNLFANTDLIIFPEWKFGSRKCTTQPRVWVDNEVFGKISNLCNITTFFRIWHYSFQAYYPRDVFPIYASIYKETKIERPNFYSKDAIPDIVNKTFKLGKDLFNNEMDFSNEENFLRSLIETSDEKLDNFERGQHMRQLTVEAQVILRLLFYGDKEFAEKSLERFKKHGGYHRKRIPKILPHLDEIISMSPYL